MTPLISEVVRALCSKQTNNTFLEDFVWFDLNDAQYDMAAMVDADGRGLRITSGVLEDIVNTPFKKCALAFRTTEEQGVGAPQVVLVEQVSPDKLSCVFIHTSTETPRDFGVDVCFESGSLSITAQHGYYQNAIDNGADAAAISDTEEIVGSSVLLTLVLLQNCLGTRLLSYRSTPSPSNPKRIAKGKKPLYDWHTVVLEPPKPKQPSKGGTHARPRGHDVRGHFSTSSLGKRYWIGPYKKKGTGGFIFKDYTTKPRTSRIHKEKTP